MKLCSLSSSTPGVWLPVLVITTLASSACSTIGLVVGKEDPLASKSEVYKIKDLSRESKDWVSVKNSEEGDNDEGAHSDRSYQSRSTASIISINSTCRKRFENMDENLTSYTDLLLLGFSDIKNRKEKNMVLADVPALETEVEGTINQEKMRVKAVVLRRRSCVYDLMYLARPHHYPKEVEIFSQFVNSLSLK